MITTLKFIKKSVIIFVVTALVSLTLSLFAHDAWVAPTKGPVYRILYGHKIPELYKFSKVTSLKVFDAAKKELAFNRIEDTTGLSIKVSKGLPAMFALEFDNGYWVKVGNESKNIRKSQMPEGTDPAHPLKYSKTILSWKPWMKNAIGQRIEFIPLHFKTVPKAGTTLKLQLLLDGKPFGGQMVENNSSEEGPKTDSNGFVTVTLVKGVNRFATDYNISQPNEPDALRLSLTAALVFIAK